LLRPRRVRARGSTPAQQLRAAWLTLQALRVETRHAHAQVSQMQMQRVRCSLRLKRAASADLHALRTRRVTP
jgi:hypothetical protein